VDAERRLDRSGRDGGHVKHVVAPAAAESVHHRVTQPLPKRLELELLVRRTEIEVCDFDGKVALEGQPDEDARADSDDGEQATAERNNDERDWRLVVDLKFRNKSML